MSPSDLEEILFQEPFRPLRATLASGDRYLINNPKRVLLVGLSMVVGLNDDPGARVGQMLKIISVPNIVVPKQIDPGRPKNGRRRRPLTREV